MIQHSVSALPPDKEVDGIFVSTTNAELSPGKDIAVATHGHPPKKVVGPTQRTETLDERVTPRDDVVCVKMHAAVAIAGEAIDQIRIGRMPDRALEVDRYVAFARNVNGAGLKPGPDAECLRVKAFY